MEKADCKFKHYLICAIVGIVTGTANGLFGAGGGTIVVPALTLCMKIDEQKAHATAISIILPLTLVSVYFYMSRSFISWDIGTKVILGGVIGGYIGARLLAICPARLLRKVFAVFIIAAAFKMLL